jgi:hypothetical protein
MVFIHRGLMTYRMAYIIEGNSNVRHPPSASTSIASHREIHPRQRGRERRGVAERRRQR